MTRRFVLLVFASLLFATCAAMGECVRFDEAPKHVGKEACVAGKVVKVNQSSRGNWYLDFCSNYRQCPFSVYIPERDAKSLGDLKSLEGQDVTVYGKVKEYNGRAEIVLRDKRQLDGEKSKYVPREEDSRRMRNSGFSSEHHSKHISGFHTNRPHYQSARKSSSQNETPSPQVIRPAGSVVAPTPSNSAENKQPK